MDPRRSAPIAKPALAPWLKGVLSIALVWHVLAVFVGPWAMAPQSELARGVVGVMGPYLQAAYLNNGYRFFAPEPGPGHLVRYEVQAGDGREIAGFFPDRATQRPRLLYHRYFMLSEFLNSLGGPEAEKLAEQYQKSYAGHLIDEYQAKTVNLYLRRHRLPTMADVRGGMRLDDPNLYDEKLLVEWTDRDE